MGIALTKLVEGKTITLSDLENKTLAIDTFNFLYQFLATIRGADGSPLTNNRGEITSHLVGILGRLIKLMDHNIQVVCIFDGKAPDLKKKEQERRHQLKEEAQKEYEIAKERKDFEAMKKFASRTSKLTQSMIEDTKEVVSLLGLPVIQAPSEGEAQAAYMAKQGDVDCIASQDFDSLLFGAPAVIRNLSITGRRKVAGKQTYITLQPELVELDNILKQLELTQEQLINLGILIGTDFNYGGVKGIGPMKGLKLVKELPTEQLFKTIEWETHFDTPYQDIINLFTDMPITKDYQLEWNTPDVDKLTDILVNKHGFDSGRVNSMLKNLQEQKKAKQQKGLSDFF